MWVITADQDASSRTGDRVEQILAHLEPVVGPQGVLLPFQRTVGDEIQAVFDSAATCLQAAFELQRAQRWAVGIGIGTADLATEARASTGPAFVRARRAVERASSKAVSVPLALEAADGAPDKSDEAAAVRDTEALLQLLAAVVRRRSEAGWAVVDRLRGGARTHREIATDLGVSPQAVGRFIIGTLTSGLRAPGSGPRPWAWRHSA